MKPVQYYESTIQDNDTNLAAYVIVVPARSLPESTLELTDSTGYEVLPKAEYLMRQLGLHPIVTLRPDPEQITIVVAALLSQSPEIWGPILDTSYEASRAHDIERILESPYRFPPQDQEFARYLTFERVIPFEESPLSSLSLADLAKAGGVTIGAYIGFVVAGATPLLFITVPAGMILCGAAAGLGAGLQKGLSDRISRLVGKK